MNAARLRRLAFLFHEIAVEFEAAAAELEGKPAPRGGKKVRRPRLPVAPPGEVDELTQAAARKVLRDAGFHIPKKPDTK